MLRIGMIGAGWVTQHHLNAYAQLAERAKVIAIADPSRNPATERAQAYSIPAVYANAAEMLDREKLDAVDVASPRETHVAMCELAGSKGLAILCQKPLAPNLRGHRILCRTCPRTFGLWCTKIGVFVLIIG